MTKEKIELKVFVEITYRDEDARQKAIEKAIEMGPDFSSSSTAGYHVDGLKAEIFKREITGG
jgi:deoxyribose-phosphate aldolase